LTLVVDASVVAKWLVAEPDSQAASELARVPGLAAPDLLLAEVGNVLWKRMRRGELSTDKALQAAQVLSLAEIELLPSRPLLVRAMEIARDADHPVYDCFYLALAESREEPLVTEDRRMLRLGGTGSARVEVLSLQEATARWLGG